MFLCIAAAAFGQEFTFRGLPWGATVEEIIAKEGKPDSNIYGQLIYENKYVSGYRSNLFFYCSLPPTENSLEMGRYVIGIANENAQAIYNDLLDKLSTLYGNPTPKTKPELNDTDKYNYWVVSKTLISLTLLIDANIRTEQGTLIFIDYYSPQRNIYGDL